MPWWSDLMKRWTWAFRPGPADNAGRRDAEGAAVTQPDAQPNIRQDGSFWSGGKGLVQLRDSRDFIDLSSVSNRQSRYKEYERLENVAEIQAALDIFADEACVAGTTKVATPFGFIPIKELAEIKKPGERFLVYCYDFAQRDYTLGWAHSPRITKRAQTVRVMLDDGKQIIATPDHKVLLRNGEWKECGNLQAYDELMPFYRIKANTELTKLKTKQFPRIFTFNDGWKHERQFIDEWRTGKKLDQYQRLNKIIRGVVAGLKCRQLPQFVGHDYMTIDSSLKREGFTYREISWLKKKHEDRRIVINVIQHNEMDVYDLSVDKHFNFATDATILHNCQTGENGHVLEVKCKNEYVKKELEFCFFRLWNIDDELWNVHRQLCKYGDFFWELVIFDDDPKAGIQALNPLPPDSIYRIETTKGKLIEFQQSKEGPDYQSLAKVEVTKASEAELAQATALRFAPEQITHLKIGDDRKTFYPYGVSIIEPARGPAHQLRLMEDAMLVYRLVRAPERRVFYIDIGQLPPFKAEAYMERMKDQYRKKKVPTNKSGGVGASGVEERWAAPAMDEDIWVPMRPNSNTRIETLPGATALGEIDDSIYFRDRLLIALNIPKSYIAPQDPSQTKVTLSSQDTRFARRIERQQKSLKRGLMQIATRHLHLRGVPPEDFDDLSIIITPPSDYREASKNEILQQRFERATALKGSELMGTYDILVEILKWESAKAKEFVSRLKQQKLEELKMQIVGQNPILLGLGQTSPNPNEIGATAAGPNTNLGGSENNTQPPELPQGEESGTQPQQQSREQPVPIPVPSAEDIEKYNMHINDYASEQDEEEIDYNEIE